MVIKYSVYKTNWDSLQSIREELHEPKLQVFITDSQKNIILAILKEKAAALLFCKSTAFFIKNF